MKIRKESSLPSTMICGIDEVGRGSFAGPLVSVAALFQGWEVGCWGVNDSKKVTAKQRQALYPNILRSSKLIDIGVGFVSVHEIDEHGIEYANELSFVRAVGMLPTPPQHIIVDGRIAVPEWPTDKQSVIAKADENYSVVGAASILAKVIRDSYMSELATRYPQYHWERNKGYGSKAHRDALQTYGPTPHHRSQFIRNVLNTDGQSKAAT